MRGMVTAVMVGCCAATGGWAQTGSSDHILQEFARCRSIPDASARLSCFETSTTALETAVKARSVTIVDRQDMREARRSLFGFTLPRINLFGGGDDGRPGKVADADDFEEINTTVASARPRENGRVEIRLADGTDAVWQTTDPMPFPPRAGDKIRIRRGTLGNYFLSTGGRAFRGMRLR